VRCGSCNEVFDGNAALLEPIAKPQPSALPPAIPLPEPTPFDEKMAALDTRAAEVLSNEPIQTLELDTALETADAQAPHADTEAALPLDVPPAMAPEPEPERASEPAPEPEIATEAEAVALPSAAEAPLDLDLDVDLDADLAADLNPEAEAKTEADAQADADAEADAPLEDALSIEALSDAELDDALQAELAVMEQSIANAAPEHEPEDEAEPSPDFFAEVLSEGGRREPTWDKPLAEADVETDTNAHADASVPGTEPVAFDINPEAAAPHSGSLHGAPHSLRDDELDDADEEALVQLSSAGLAEAQSARAHAYLKASSAPQPVSAGEADDAAGEDASNALADDTDDTDEPGFVKRDRRRQKFGKAATIGMSLGSVLLLAALAGQGLTTFRNQLAAAMPPLKPALLAACNTLGCKIELPTQIDDLTIEQGELQTLSETTFSFTTLLRNQSATAQAWPHIELVLDDAADKHILRRVFTPRDYLGADVALDKGFAPHTEQSVKLYFELNELKASGYHIAVFYP